MKKMNLLYTKSWSFDGRYRSEYIGGENGPQIAVRIFNRYTIEAAFTPYTWGAGVKITCRSDHKSISLRLLPFCISFGLQEEVR